MLRCILPRIPSKLTSATTRSQNTISATALRSTAACTLRRAEQHGHRNLSTEAEDKSSEEAPLSNTATLVAIQKAFTQRAADAIRYEYFAQRAELEAEVETAQLFRSLIETSKQQAMGFMELLEEYNEAEFGSTLTNLEIMTDIERRMGEEDLVKGGDVAEEEEFEHVKEWFEDVGDACCRAADRLEYTASVLDAEELEGDEDDAEDGVKEGKR
ncbi:hypothetical protein BWQ96_04995 [Gracilariopsis chorda]|uniref:Uncharacterized protein n=1 Tax=Gracilariopsis chorda TaxID=448386 RepID=A0A2V3IT01_9FLOR|nr:hypothetical protein BWQ96_04995 [Gracilariopsis chorda]|eukprot:PXF45229.1 hypothetical protein BWQ96_04995 [Gracilariopsis chorda]